MSRKLVVAAGQLGPASDDKAANVEAILRALGGEVVARAKTDGDEVVLAEIDLDDAAEARTRMPFPRDRRPEHYRDLTTP